MESEIYNRNTKYLPFASVKSLMPPPTVNGTKTFSEVYLNTYNSKKTESTFRVCSKDKITFYRFTSKD